MTVPNVRATSSTRDPVEDPTEDVLAELLAEVVDDRSEYLIVERVSDAEGQTHIQTASMVQTAGDGSALQVVEHRFGGPEAHFRAFVPRNDFRGLFWAWVRQAPGWDLPYAWERVDVG